MDQEQWHFSCLLGLIHSFMEQNIYFTLFVNKGHTIEQNRVFPLKNLKSQNKHLILGLLGHMVVVFQDFLRSPHTVLQSDCIKLHSH